MKREQLVKLLNETGTNTDEVFMRGNNSFIIPIDNAIVMGDGSGKDEICLINGNVEIPIKKASNDLYAFLKINFHDFLLLLGENELIDVIYHGISRGAYTVKELMSKSDYLEKQIKAIEICVDNICDIIADDSELKSGKIQPGQVTPYILLELMD